MFHLLHPRIGYTNSYEVVSAIPAFVSLGLSISQTNRYGVDGVIPVLFLLCPRIDYTNSYAVDGTKLVFHLLCPRIGHTNHPVVVGTTPLICAWAVMSCLLSQIIYIIRCVAVWKEMVFVGRTSNTQTYKPTLS